MSRSAPNTTPVQRRPAMVVLCVLAAIGLLGVSAAAWVFMQPGSNGNDRSGKPMTVPETMAYLAGDEVERAIRWLERRADAAADDFSRVIEQTKPERLLAEASTRIARRLGGFEYQPGDTGEDWERLVADPTQEPGSAVLLVHGLDEPGDIWDELAPALAQQGHRVLRFNYANDQSPATSADQLASFLQRSMAIAGIESVSVVGHSMGGLVLRDVLTRHAQAADWSGPQVTRMITVGTPNHGSPVAALQPIGEAREIVARVWAARSLEPAEMLGFLIDGSGEAAAALAIDSSYLTDLNARDLPPGIEITIIAAEASTTQREALDELASAAPVAGLLSAESREVLLAQVDRMTDFIGDGVVPITSTPLEGVTDYQIVSANHRSMLRTMPILSTDPIPPAIPIILDRLSQQVPSKAPNKPAE